MPRRTVRCPKGIDAQDEMQQVYGVYQKGSWNHVGGSEAGYRSSVPIGTQGRYTPGPNVGGWYGVQGLRILPRLFCPGRLKAIPGGSSNQP